MILADSAILAGVQDGTIEITPFRDEQLNPASYDVTLGRYYHVLNPLRMDPALRVPDPPPQEIPDTGLELVPDRFYLMHTEEIVHTDCYVAVLDGKSSLGRVFLRVHQTAGYIDPGFRGQVTLEVMVSWPILVRVGMRIGQLRWHPLVGKVKNLYRGNYQKETAMGPVLSRIWNQV